MKAIRTLAAATPLALLCVTTACAPSYATSEGPLPSRSYIRAALERGTSGEGTRTPEILGATVTPLHSARAIRTLPSSASFVFPVDGVDAGAIRSVWGDPRSGGRRHEGVDIFAQRGTPVLAADDGVVVAARTTPIGGKVIWLRPDGEDVELYYAHLDRHDVRAGMRVSAGQQIGTVGDTGNARGTHPHLHFGVYREGGRVAINPESWIARSAPLYVVDRSAGVRGAGQR